MRKTILSPGTDDAAAPEAAWLDLEKLATVEVTSEDPAHPIERALGVMADAAGGWRASTPGDQTLRLRFDAPRRLTRVSLLFMESARTRTQELALAWSNDGTTFREILRQQWNFSPDGSTRELEDVRVELEGVRALQLVLKPDISDPSVLASLERLRVA